MIIGIPKEIKDHEYRVGITPAMVQLLVNAGHTVYVETQAGAAIGLTDAMFQSAGARTVSSPAEVYQADMIIKVKEPQKSEFPLLKEDQILFCYLHLAPDPIQTQQLIEKKVVGIAYETVTDKKGQLPLLAPMSEIAGRIAVQVGATYLQLNHGGRGVLLGGVPGVPPARVIILGGGNAGTEAARMAIGCGADVTILDNNLSQLKALDMHFGPRLKTLYSSPLTIEESVISADLVISTVLIPGKTSPKLITRSMIKRMAPGSVFIDVSIDQGGSSETSKPTTHENPIYLVDGVIHYCVTNMPGACARTATYALTHATSQDALSIANKGYRAALLADPGLLNGLNVCHGKMTNASVAHDLGYPYVAPQALLQN